MAKEAIVLTDRLRETIGTQPVGDISRRSLIVERVEESAGEAIRVINWNESPVPTVAKYLTRPCVAVGGNNGQPCVKSFDKDRGQTF